MKHNLLLVEDEALVREIVTDYFENEQWTIYEAETGVLALDLFERHSIDLVILDIMLPELDGWTVCKQIRKSSDVPIIMLTAKGEDDDKVLGYELGADDYVTKPFSPRVLVAQAKALLKRAEGRISGEEFLLQFGSLELNTKSYSVTIAGADIDLSPKEYDLLIYLVRNKGIVLSRDTILNAVWGFDYFGDIRTVDTHIKKLRAKLGNESERIVTVIRAGYRFEAEK
ncbi:response regulator transcription factor [Peribacillus psychrosaccharolyticus]|uniref:Response regulator transcription factor n=1 Tax=Peribacillus psychrosaccharolyticus TaxID=1407 RepID=A0A974RYZ0_PERPY|nr:response regulator transcription factor [Peribacillus psychrosaccharolyticus]MEC2055200.1 response regulator transcription factor [Peribacillus psychrosaccharolyticus]MED3745190.1 response regulator transcription factor [Peribacillus psychrosaccharolyticus]QQS98913.1 response regulator transcription factor [Peribacillus psychrosaccharolyticus]